MKISETQLVSQICQYLQYLENQDKLMYSRINTTGIFDQRKGNYRRLPLGVKKGFSDIIIIINGKIIFMEAKTDKNSQTDNQKDFEQLCQIHHAPYFVVRHIDDVKEILKNEGIN